MLKLLELWRLPESWIYNVCMIFCKYIEVYFQPWNWVGHFGLGSWQCCQIGFWFLALWMVRLPNFYCIILYFLNCIYTEWLTGGLWPSLINLDLKSQFEQHCTVKFKLLVEIRPSPERAYTKTPYKKTMSSVYFSILLGINLN